jgi:hypothetical protein
MRRTAALLVLLAAVDGPALAAGPDDLSLTALSACDGSDEGPRPVLADEAAALRADRQARRAGPLIAEYAGGPRRRRQRLVIGRAVLVDRTIDPQSGDGVIRSFAGRYGGSPVALVRQRFFESVSYLLVDASSGRTLVTGGAPVRGPGGRVFAAVTRSGGYAEPSVEVIDWRGGGFGVTRFAIRACGLAWDGLERLRYRSGFDGGAAGVIERRDGRWVDLGAGGDAGRPAARLGTAGDADG